MSRRLLFLVLVTAVVGCDATKGVVQQDSANDLTVRHQTWDVTTFWWAKTQECQVVVRPTGATFTVHYEHEDRRLCGK